MLDADEHYDKEAGRLHLATELPTSMATQSTSENGLVTGHRTEEPATEEEMPRTTVEQDGKTNVSLTASRPQSHHSSSNSSASFMDAAPTSPTQLPQAGGLPQRSTLPPPSDDKLDVNSGSKVESFPSKAPLSAHRISATSLDDINLGEAAGDDAPARSRSPTLLSRLSGAQVPTQLVVPPMPPTDSPNTNSESLTQAPPYGKRSATLTPPVKKLTSPFSWLSRNISLSAKDPSPAAAAGSNQLSIPPNNTSRNTTAYTGLTLGQNGEGHSPNVVAHEVWKSSYGSSLRDRFKIQRMKKEAGIDPFGAANRNPAAGSPAVDPTGQKVGDGSEHLRSLDLTDQASGKDSDQATSPSVSSTPSNIDTNLAPGTAAGILAGPPSRPDSEAIVDWDLWQALVYEGPTVVAQKSSAELSQAIASGIPSAIRGVVWQVLANSKSEEMERTYERLAYLPYDRSPPKKGQAIISTGMTTTEKKVDTATSPGKSGAEESKHVSSSSVLGVTDAQSPSLPAVNGNDSLVPPVLDTAETGAYVPADSPREHELDPAVRDPVVLQKLEKAIKKDLGARTSFSKYAASAGLQDGLFRVCRAYALFDKTVGYAQGMNFLVMPLLFNMSEEEAFCLFVRLMYHYKLREMFIPDMSGLHLHLYQFQRLLEDHEPALFCHLRRRGVDPDLYATQWFLTLFAYRFPLQLVLRVFDLVLNEGLEGAILRFGLVLMQKNASALMEMTDMSQLTHFLKERLFDVYIDQAPSASSILESGFFGSTAGIDKAVYRADSLVQDACAVKVTAEALKGYTDDWTEKVRLEKEREAEIETLRSTNSNLSIKVRSLEERIEKFDTEHVQVASELVRTKVENEELRDEGENLREQLEGLKRAVENQPREIEASLKEEMDRIMQRNLEVQNENRALEEQMSEMEKELVDAKMRHAEIDSAHEALKQKWNDLKKALGD